MKFSKSLCIVVSFFLFSGLSVLAQTEFTPDIWLDRADFSISGTGELSGAASGSVTVVGTDQVEFSVYDEEEGEFWDLSFIPNAGKDILFMMQTDDPEEYPETEFILLTMIKKPDSLTQEDLEGDWRLVELEMVREEGFSAVSPGTFSTILSVNSNGVVNVEGDTGQINVATNLQVALVFPDETLLFDMNTSKTMMFNMDEQDDGTIFIRYLMKSAPIGALSDVAGDWRADSLEIESVNGRDYSAFLMEGSPVSFSAGGAYTTPDGDSGSISIYGGKDLALQEAGEPIVDIFRLNGAHDFAAMAQEFDEGEFHDLVLLSKEPASLTITDLAGDWAFYDLSIAHIQDTGLRTNTAYYADETTIAHRYEHFFDFGNEVRDGFYEENHEDGSPAVRASYDQGEFVGVYQRHSLDGDLEEDHFYAPTNSFRYYTYYSVGVTNRIDEWVSDTNDQDIVRFTMSFYEDGRPGYASRDEHLPNGTELNWSTNWTYFVDGSLSDWYAGYTAGTNSSSESESYNEVGQPIHISRDLNEGGVSAFWSTNWNYRADGTLEEWSGTHDYDVPQWSWSKGYHEDGLTLASSSVSSNGLRHGAQEIYAANGTLTELSTYNFDLREGPWEEYTAAGIQILREHYQNDRLHGIRRVWSPSGTLLEDGFYFAGRVHGDLYRYLNDGRISSHERYEYQVRTYSMYYNYFPAGGLSSTVETTIDTEGDISEQRYWYENGELNSVSRTVGGERHGEQLLYAPTGVLLRRSFYVDGIESGAWEVYWEDNGQLQTTGLYLKGEETGLWSYYNQGGQLIQETEYLNGTYHGRLRTWRDDGELTSDVFYAHGFRQSESTYSYYPDSRDVANMATRFHDESGRHDERISYYESGTMQARYHSLNDENHGTQETWFEDGQKEDYSEYENGLRHGLHERWLADGTPQAHCMYRFGKLHGECMTYHLNGEVATRFQYVDGMKSGLQLTYNDAGNLLLSEERFEDLLEGTLTRYSASGVLAEVATYQQNILHGPWKSYHLDGTTIRYEATYTDGLLDGLWAYYLADGFLWNSKMYALGTLNGASITYSPSGSRTETMYVDGMRHGNEDYYDTPTHLSRRTPYVNGLIHGTQTSWHYGSTRISQTYVYVNGIRSGAYKSYYASGSLNTSGSYTLNLKHGTWVSRYDGGGTSSTQEWVYGVRHGAYRYYYSNGTLGSRGQYSGGEASGTWTYYNFDGSVNDTESFGSGLPAPEAPELNDPFVAGQLKVVLTGYDGDRVPGKVVLEWGDNSSNTLWVGETGVGFASFSVSNSTPISVTAYSTGYFTNSADVTLTMQQPYAVVPLGLTQFEGPIIQDVTPESGDHFMHGISFNSPYQVDVNWQESTPGHLEYRINGVRPSSYYGNGFDSIAVQMASGLFEASASKEANEIEVIAVSQEGLKSEPFSVYPIVYAPPQWIPNVLGAFQEIYGQNAYGLNISVPEQPFSAKLNPALLPEPLKAIWGSVPYIGGYPIGLLESQVGMKMEISTSGTGNAAAAGQSGFTAGGVEIKAKLAGSSALGFTYSDSGGPQLEEMELRATLGTKISRSVGLLELLPSLKNIKNTYPTLGSFIEELSSTASANVSVGLTGESLMAVDEHPVTKALAFTTAEGSMQGDMEFGLALALGAMETSVTGKGQITYTWMPATDEADFDYTLDGTGEIELGFSWRNIDVLSTQVQIWAESPEPRLLALDVSPMATGFLAEPDFNRLSLDMAPLAEGENTLIGNVFPRANPKLVAGAVSHGVIYVSMDPNDPVAQGSEINFIYFDGTNYLAPLVLEDNAVGEFAPDAVELADGRVLAVWERVNNPALDGLDLEAFAAALEIVWSVYTPATHSWSTPAALSDNTYLDQSPRLIKEGTNVVVWWESNIGGEIISSTNAPSELNLARWNGSSFETAETVPHSFTGGYAYDAAIHADVLRILYVQDADADYSTTGDRDLYLLDGDLSVSNGWNTPYQLTLSEADESSPRVVATSNAFEMFWIREGALVQDVGGALGSFTELISAKELAGASSFEVVVTGNDRLFSWAGLNNGRPDVACRYSRDGLLGRVNHMTDDDRWEKYITGASLADGSLALSFVSESNGVAHLQLIEFEADIDLIATSISLDKEPVPGTYVTVSTLFESSGLLDSPNPAVIIYEQGGAPWVTNQIYFDSEGFAETSWGYMIPNSTGQVVLIAEVDPYHLVSEQNESNNTVSVELFSPNLRIIDLEVIAASGGVYQVMAEVQNDGSLASAVSEIVFDAGDGVTPLLPVEALSAGTSTVVSTVFSDAELFSNRVANLVVTVDPNNMVAESSETDNVLMISMTEPIPAFADTDLDDIDDYWEMIVFGDLDEDGLQDSDGDGMNDRAEFFAGTHPLDNQSALWINLDVGEVDSLLEWTTEPGVTYRLEYTTDLTSGIWVPIGGNRATPGYEPSTDSQIDPLSSADRFYRVRVITE